MSLRTVVEHVLDAKLPAATTPSEAYSFLEQAFANIRRSTRADHEAIDDAIDEGVEYQRQRHARYLRECRREALEVAFERQRLLGWRWLRRKGYVLVNVYEVHRCYGGPEEGGWWYDAGHCVRTEIVWRPLSSMVGRQLEAEYSNEGRRELSSVLSDGRYYVAVDDAPPGSEKSAYPSTIPHYE